MMGIFIAPAAAPAALSGTPVDSSASAGASALSSQPLAAPSVGDRPLRPSGAAAAARPLNVRASGATARDSADLQVYWGRLVFAAVVLLVILVGGFTAAILKLDAWSTLLIHSFELLLGIFTGLLGGDIVARRAS